MVNYDRRLLRLCLFVGILLLLGGYSSAAFSAQHQIIDLGFSHTVVLRDDGTVRAWGNNESGQLGNGSFENSEFPVVVSGLSNVISVAAGNDFSIALKSDGTVWAWGNNGYGALAQPSDIDNSNLPVMVGISNVISIKAGNEHALALKNDGTILAWGENSAGQIGDGSTDSHFSPVQVVGITGAAAIEVGGYHSYARLSDNTNWQWGANINQPASWGSKFLEPIQLESWAWDHLFAKGLKNSTVAGRQVISNMKSTVVLQDDGTILANDVDGGPVLNASMAEVIWAGALSVTIEPEEAAALGVQWRINNGEWRDSGTLVTDIIEGNYLVEFRDTYKWAAPASQNIFVAEGQANEMVATAIRKLGDVTVTISPQSAIDDGAQWRIRGGTWNSSGYTATDLPVGNYVIEFSDLSTWEPPEPIALPLRVEGAAISAQYQTKRADLTVEIEPAEVAGFGAQWRIAGGEWLSSGDTLEQLPLGDYVVEFSDVDNWHTPASRNLTLGGAGASITTAYQVKTGSLSVRLDPSNVAAAGARWRIAGGDWLESGQVISNLPVAVYSIEFMALDDWYTPATQNVVVQEGSTQVIGDYTAKTGGLHVVIEPLGAVDEGAKWRLAGEVWQAAGDALSDLPVGEYTIEYANTNSWIAPPAQSVTVSADTIEQVRANYEIKRSGLSVQMQPSAAVAAGARWRIVGGEWQVSGAVVHDVPVGQYVIEFNAVEGWHSPESVSVQLPADGVSVEASYQGIIGTLSVKLMPRDQLDGEAKWRIGNGEWIASGGVVDNLSLGDYVIELSDVPDWVTPAARTVTVADQYQIEEVIYQRRVAPLSVSINPASVVSDGAQWRLAGESVWRTSGDRIAELETGTYTIEFAEVSGWSAPQVQEVYLSADGLSLTGDYTQVLGKLTVNVEPIEAVNAGAQWQVFGKTAWLYSGDSVDLGADREYSVDFNKLDGWAQPETQQINMTADGVELLVQFERSDAVEDQLLSGTEMADAVTLHAGDVYKGMLTSNGSAVFMFEAVMEERYILSTRSSAESRIRIYDFNGTGVAESEGSVVTGRSRLAWQAPSSDSYFVEVFFEDASEGEFYLGLAQQGAIADFDGNGLSDLLLRDDESGQTAIEFTGYEEGVSGDTYWYAGSTEEWQIAGVADFNGDAKADILWRGGNGKTVIWMMDGLESNASLSGKTSHQLGGLSQWAVTDIGDFDGDGRADILWRHSKSGRLALWFMEGTSVRSDSGMLSAQVRANSAWSLTASGDFNGDGSEDLLWSNAVSGKTAIWFMQGKAVSNESGLTSLVDITPLSWKLISSANFGGDEADDLIYQRADGSDTTHLLIMAGLEVSQENILTGVGADEGIAAVGDYNGDGRQDLLIKNSNREGYSIYSLVDGSRIASEEALDELSLTKGSWRIYSSHLLNTESTYLK